MSYLADAVLPLIRTRTDLHRWSVANAHGKQMHEAIDIHEAAIPEADPGEVYGVTHKALASAVKVIARADDSSGIIGDACRRLFGLHPRAAVAAVVVPPGRLVEWMIRFQLDGDVDYFDLDPVAYAPALGEHGMACYRSRLEEVRAHLGPEPSGIDQFAAPDRHQRWVLDFNARRLAVLDRDVEAIIRTHARDRQVAAWFYDTAHALAEIGECDHAIDWARAGMDVGPRHQSLAAAGYWCTLLTQNRPAEVLTRGWWCSGAGLRPTPSHICTGRRATDGRRFASRSSTASPTRRATRQLSGIRQSQAPGEPPGCHPTFRDPGGLTVGRGHAAAAYAGLSRRVADQLHRLAAAAWRALRSRTRRRRTLGDGHLTPAGLVRTAIHLPRTKRHHLSSPPSVVIDHPTVEP